VPETIGRYEIERELGRGGMAIVFLARDPLMDRPVAVKVLPRQFTFDPNFRARFKREAQVVARLQHPAIVTVYDFGEQGDQLYLVMAYLRGGSLHDRLRGGPLPLAECARILGELAPALDAAHQQGMIHRDLKPGNILFDQWDRPYLADFGIAKLIAGSDTDLTPAGGLIGTPAYMSPEQALALKELDGRSDLYALGVIFFQMVTGRIPFTADTPMGIALKHISEPVPLVTVDNPSLPPTAQAVIERAMAKEPDDRYGTAGELATAVRELAGHLARVVASTPSAETQKAVARPPAAAAQGKPASAAAEAKSAVEKTAIDRPPPSIPAGKEPARVPAWPVRAADPRALDRPPSRAAAGASGERNWLVPAAGSVLVIALLLFLGLRGLLAGGAGDRVTPMPTNDLAAAPETPNPIRRPEQVATDKSVPPPSGSLGDTWTRPSDGMVMVYVPAGSFMMGSAADDSDAFPDEFPQHEVYLDAYWLDRTEVTNDQFTAFIADTGHTTTAEEEGRGYIYDTDWGWGYVDGADWQHPRGPDSDLSGLSNHPVVLVSWEDADAYCAWAGGRLPTEAQWEYAARGPTSLKYPWGDSDPSRYLLQLHRGDSTASVGSYPDGASWTGALDMAGNVWEWVADWYDADYYDNSPRENPDGPSSGDRRLLRGGGLSSGTDRNIRSAKRYFVTGVPRGSIIGFRCSVPQA
jgi:eukaryotic-like serine/threonine-protein kinase